MVISVKQIKELRDKTGSGMMACKKALQDAEGDMDRAIELLRKKGKKLSEKRADREANQGLILTKVGKEGKKAAALEINCETDFVARNDSFQEQTNQFLQVAFDQEIDSVSELLDTQLDELTVNDHLKEMVGQIGEKITINHVIFVETEGEIVSYIHPGNQLGVLVEFEGPVDDKDIAKDVAMQVAAMDPLAVTRDEIDESIVEKELEIAKEQLRNANKPEKIIDKAAKGKLRRFYEDNVLMEQKFVKDNSISIADYLKQHQIPDVIAFYRLQLGDDES
jgi:elongation factor Ts